MSMIAIGMRNLDLRAFSAWLVLMVENLINWYILQVALLVQDSFYLREVGKEPLEEAENGTHVKSQPQVAIYLHLLR